MNEGRDDDDPGYGIIRAGTAVALGYDIVYATNTFPFPIHDGQTGFTVFGRDDFRLPAVRMVGLPRARLVLRLIWDELRERHACLDAPLFERISKHLTKRQLQCYVCRTWEDERAYYNHNCPRIIGRALAVPPPSGQIDVLWGHFK